MSETCYRCPFRGDVVRVENGYCVGSEECDDNCCEAALKQARATRAREIEAAKKPWREAVTEWRNAHDASMGNGVEQGGVNTKKQEMRIYRAGVALRALLDKEAK